MKRKEKINKKIRLSKKINRGYWITILLITLTGLLVGLRIYGHYMYTSVWEKGEETKIAEEEAYMLYLTPKERQTLKSYTKLVSDIYNREEGDFTDSANNENIEKLSNEYNSLPDNLKDKESKTYNTIITLYPIRKTYKSFFRNENEINTTTTPSEIISFVSKYGETIKNASDDPDDKSNKKFANEVYTSIYNFKDDIGIISNIVDVFSSTFEVKTNQVNIKKDVSSNLIVNWNSQINSLHYKWLVINDYFSPIIKKAENILNSHDKQIEKVNVYNKTKENKESFEKFISSYESYRNKLLDIPTLTTKSDLDKYKDNITFNIKEEYSDDIEKDKIISQYPKKGDYNKIYKDSIIDVVISKGKKPEEKPKETSSSSSSEQRRNSTTSSSSRERVNNGNETETRADSSSENKENN